MVKRAGTSKAMPIKLNDEKVGDDKFKITSSDFNEEGAAKLSFGKKRHILLTLSS